MDTMGKYRHETQQGFTFVEILIAIVAGAIVVIGIFRLFALGISSYNLQEMLADLYQNGTYAMQRLNEAIVQAGSNLPESNYQVVFSDLSNLDTLAMRVNLYGGNHQYTVDSCIGTAGSTKVPLADARGFIGADSLVCSYIDNTVMEYKISKVDTTPVSAPDTVTIAGTSAGTPAFRSGAWIYASSTRAYYLKSNTLCMMDSAEKVIAENIDSVAFVFYKRDGTTPTTIWDSMMIASVYVRARTSMPDPKYKDPVFNDGYRRLPLSMKFRLKNKW